MPADDATEYASLFCLRVARTSRRAGIACHAPAVAAYTLLPAVGSKGKATVERHRRIVVAIDPATSTNEGSDETGIICAGIGDDGDFYVLDDVSGVMSPLEWGREAISLYRARRADRVVGEKNQGGDMVEHTLRSIDPNVSYSPVWVARGKVVRAEPIAALYEQHRVHHCGTFNKLEDQLTCFATDFDRKAMGFSPDRLDALVWALTDLAEGSGAEAGRCS